MKKLTIGYRPLSPYLTSPGDRRRLLFWAETRGHEVITDLAQKVDIIVASENSDFQESIFALKGVPVIFDLIDGYLSPQNIFEDFARGLAKNLTGQISGGIKPFSHHIKDFCTRSDAVICSSVEQEVLIKQYNSNTHVILDSHDEIPLILPKFAGHLPSKMPHILWEGQPATIRGVQELSATLATLAEDFDLRLDFVTDEKYFKYLGKYLERTTSRLLLKDLRAVINRVIITSWTPESLVAIARESSIAMIPTDLSVPMTRLKPENRLLIMWRLGLPCLTSPSPAYTRVAQQAGVDAICESPEKWLAKFQKLLENPSFAYQEVLRGQNYLSEMHNRDALLTKWDRAFESVVG